MHNYYKHVSRVTSLVLFATGSKKKVIFKESYLMKHQPNLPGDTKQPQIL